MKKSTSKRERKFGKKNEDGIKISKDSSERVVKVMVDGFSIMTFKNIKEAEVYINKQHKEAERLHRPQTSYVII